MEYVPACERGVETGFFWPKSFHDSMIIYSSIYVVLPHKYVSTNVRRNENRFLCAFFLADKDHFISLLHAVLSKHFFRNCGWNFCPAHPYKSIVAVWFLKFCSWILQNYFTSCMNHSTHHIHIWILSLINFFF